MPDLSKSEPVEEKALSNSPEDEALLKRIRDDFAYVKSYWFQNYEQAEKDMACVAGMPPPEFIEDRANRPCIWPDETSQYLKQWSNSLRENKRSIKISPRSEGATDKDAEHRQAYIRGIEYASKAQSIYATAAEACGGCAFGYFRIITRITGSEGEQEPRLARIPNQFTVYPDPDAQEADFSDSMIYFVFDSMRKTAFARKYKNAKKRSFTGADIESARGWFNGEHITVAEYWTREEVDKQDGEPRYEVTQRITNGVEILETNKWLGSWIPIIGVFGEELYLRDGGETKRIFMSMVRRARGAQQMMAYIASQEAEEFGMAPRAPLMGYKGQFNSQEHALIHKVVKAYIEFKVPTDWKQEWGPPPLPSRVPFTPNSQAYEISYERWRRSHQAAMGVTPLPTAAQRNNEKSGIALEKITTQEAIGSFHLTDNFLRAFGNCGRQLNELITKLGETNSLPKTLLGKDQKDEDVKIQVATEGMRAKWDKEKQDPASEHLDESEYFFAHRGIFEVTVSEGPNYQSQREEAAEFADHLLEVLPQLGLPPQIIQAVAAIAVKMKNIGALGDEIHDLLSPPDPNDLSPQAKAILAQSQGTIQQLQAELKQLQLEKLGKVVEAQGKIALVREEAGIRMTEADKDRETKITVAEITTKAQSLSERMAAFEDLMKQLHSQAHDIAMAVQEQGHAKDLAAQQHQQALEQGDQAAENASLQSSQDAAQQQQTQPEAS